MHMPARTCRARIGLSVTDSPRRVLLLEPSPSLRQAVEAVLSAEGYLVTPCDSIEQLVARAHESAPELALAAWQTLNGLLSDERRHDLAAVTRRVRLVLMVPRSWLRILQPGELGLAGLLAKPIDPDELLECVRRAAPAQLVS